MMIMLAVIICLVLVYLVEAGRLMLLTRVRFCDLVITLEKSPALPIF